MKKLLFLITLIIVLLTPSKVHAWCTSEELNNLKKIANEVTITYEHQGLGYFDIKIQGIAQEFYIEDESTIGYSGFYWYGESETTATGYEAGQKYNFIFFASESTSCKGIKLRSYKITIPYYNKYYTQSFCDGIEEFYLCGKFVDTSEYSVERVYELATKYKKEKEEKNIMDDVADHIQELTRYEKITTYISENYRNMLIIIALLGSIGIAITLYAQKRRSII